MRWRSALLTVSSALLLSACGGDDGQVESRTDTGPTIEQAVVDRLAGRSDKIANLLDSGDTCGAKQEAEALERDFNETVDEIPELYLEDLGSAIHEIAAAIPPCNPPPPPPPPTNTETDQGGDGDD